MREEKPSTSLITFLIWRIFLYYLSISKLPHSRKDWKRQVVLTLNISSHRLLASWTNVRFHLIDIYLTPTYFACMYLYFSAVTLDYFSALGRETECTLLPWQKFNVGQNVDHNRSRGYLFLAGGRLAKPNNTSCPNYKVNDMHKHLFSSSHFPKFYTIAARITFVGLYSIPNDCSYC